MERAGQCARWLQASRGARGASRATRGHPSHPRAAAVRGRVAHRPQDRGVSPRRRSDPHRVVSGDGRAGRDRRAAGGDRKCGAGYRTRAGIPEVPGRRAWAAAWEHAVRRADGRVADALDAEITRTARQVRLPRRRLRRRLLSNAEKRAIVARLGTGGGTFVAALDALETAAGRVTDASVLEKDAHAEWQEALRTVARRLE